MSLFETLKELCTVPTVKKAQYDEKTEIMTLTYTNLNTVKFHGSCTCWNYYPNMERVNIFMESELHRYWKYNKVHKKPYIVN